MKVSMVRLVECLLAKDMERIRGPLRYQAMVPDR